MSSTVFQRKLDLAPTASIDKVALNNRVVLMRAVVRRSKLHLINALVKRVHKLRDKKGTEDQKSQNKNKADRMLEDIKIIKVLKPDYVSKYALSTTVKFEDLAAKSSTTAEMRALARLAAQKFITQEVVKFRREHEDWKELAAYLMTKHTSREFKKKKTKEKMKKVETNVKASENLVQKYLGEKLEGISDLDSEHNESESDDDDGDSDNDSDEADQRVNEKYEKKNKTLVNDRGRIDSLRTESEIVESVRKAGVNLNSSSLKNKGMQKQTEMKRVETYIQGKERNENIESGSDEENVSRMTDNSNESEDDDNDNEAQDDNDEDDGTDESNDDDDGDDNDDDDDGGGGDNDDESSDGDSDNDLEHSEKQTINNPSKHNAKLLDKKRNKPNSKGVLSKNTKHQHKGTRSNEFTKITEKRNTIKEKVEGEMIVKKLNLAKDFVEDEIPKILLSDSEGKPVKRKKKMKDLFFDTGEDGDSGNHNKDQTELNDDGDFEDGDNETTDNRVGGNFERSIQPTMTAFTTCFVGSLKSSDMMACKDNQYRSNEDWKRIRHETKEQKMGRGSNASYSRGRGHGPMSRGSSNGFVPQRGRGRGFSDGFRGRGFSQGHRGRGFSEGRGRGSEGFQGRGRGSEGFQGRGRCSEGFQGRERGLEGFQGRGRGRGFDRSGREDSQNDRRGLGNVQAESKKQGSLHPSWEASKKRKQEQKAVLQAFEGKKIKFDD